MTILNRKKYFCLLFSLIFMGIFGFVSITHASLQPTKYQSSAQTAKIAVKIDKNTDYNLECQDNKLTISFSKPYARSLTSGKQKLPQWIKSVTVSSDSKQAKITTKFPVTAQNHLERNWLHIELNKITSDTNQAAIDKKNKIGFSYQKHDKFDRLIFEFNPKHRPQYSLKPDSQTVTLSFYPKVSLKSADLKKYKYAQRITQKNNRSNGTDIIINNPLLQSFKYKNKLVLDLSPQPEEAPALAQTSGVIKSKTIFQNAQVTTKQSKNQVTSLSFPWNMPVGLAVFQRDKYIWLIFDHHQKINLDEIKKSTSKLISGILEIPHNKGMVLRLEPKKDVKVGVRQEGLLWIIDFYTHDIPYIIKELPLFVQYNSLNQAYLYVPTVNAGNIISVVDPETGDGILASPNTEYGIGISQSYHYPDLDILPAQQGFALAPITSDIIATRGNTGVSIRADHRGLNISDNLEALKRRKLLDKNMQQNSFGLNIPLQLLKLPFREAEWQLYDDLRTTTLGKKDQANLEIAKYYIAKGLGTNALRHLNQMRQRQSAICKTDKFFAAHGVANFLAKRYDDAIDDFSHGELANNDEALFWRTLASSALEYKKENNVILFSFISIMKDYPQELKERIAIVGAETAIKANDDITTQNFMDVLKSSAGNEYRQANILYLNGQKFTLQGYPRNAIREFNKIVNMKSQKFSSLARFEKNDLLLKLGAISNAKAIAEYERLRFAWGEHSFKMKLLNKLAQVYVADKNYYQALQTYKEAASIADLTAKQEIITKMVKLFENIYLKNRADDMSPLKALALYRDFEWLAPRSDHYSEIVQHLADRLVAVDLLARAAELLKEQLRMIDLELPQRNKIGSRLALIYLLQGDNVAALDVLDQTHDSEAPAHIKKHRDIIRAKALANLGKKEEALSLLAQDYSKNAILLKAEIYWNTEDWHHAADTIKYLIEKPVSGRKLSDEQISYILNWATALKKSGKETVIVRLHNKFLPFFKDTPYYSTFKVLTSNLEKDKIDMKAINQAIQDITSFSNFSKIYNQSLREKDLAVNAPSADEADLKPLAE